jgi:hypothetical protein
MLLLQTLLPLAKGCLSRPVTQQIQMKFAAAAWKHRHLVDAATVLSLLGYC